MLYSQRLFDLLLATDMQNYQLCLECNKNINTTKTLNIDQINIVENILIILHT